MHAYFRAQICVLPGCLSLPSRSPGGGKAEGGRVTIDRTTTFLLSSKCIAMHQLLQVFATNCIALLKRLSSNSSWIDFLFKYSLTRNKQLLTTGGCLGQQADATAFLKVFIN